MIQVLGIHVPRIMCDSALWSIDIRYFQLSHGTMFHLQTYKYYFRPPKGGFKY